MSTPFSFPFNLSADNFEQIAIQTAKPIKRLTVEVRKTIIYGSVLTNSGIDRWCFELDFNDYGRLTGNYYWNYCENNESSLPDKYAERLKQNILNRLSQ